MTRIRIPLACIAILAFGLPGSAQTRPALAPASSPTSSPTLTARVIELRGDVRHAPSGTREWKPCAVGDEYPPQTKLLTGVRSAIKLQFGDGEPYSCMLIESVGLVELSDLALDASSKQVRVGVNYGRIRAGVAEGGVESSFTVDSPVATLSKRGTWGFTLYYERASDEFEIGLTDRGLVEALNRDSGARRTLGPREYVTHAMRNWLDESAVRHNVAVVDILGQGDIDLAFHRLRNDGLGVTAPGEGRLRLIDLSSRAAQADFADRLSGILQAPQFAPPITPGTRVRPEGFFGTGRGEDLVELLIESSDPLAQKGFAAPGRYRFPRSVLQSWLAQRR